MKFSKVGPQSGNYLTKDKRDLDEVVYSEAINSDVALAPTGDHLHDLTSLLTNRSPRTGQRLLDRGGRVSGFSIALTAPKCFSLLEVALLDPRLQGTAADAARRCLLLAASLSAPREGQPDPEQLFRLAAFMALHRLSRLEYPHRHGHASILSLAYDPAAKRYNPADLSLVLRYGHVFQALFQHGLSLGLARAGYSVQREGDSVRVEGFPRQLVERFSCTALEDEKPRRGRKRAGSTEEFEPLREVWLSCWSPDERRTVADLPRRPTPTAAAGPDYVVFRNALFVAKKSLLDRDFFVPVGDLLAEALREAFGYEVPEPAVLAQVLKGDLHRLPAFPVGDRLCYGSPEGLAQELDFHRQLRGTSSADSGWLRSPATIDAWWAPLLGRDTHRVAVLRGNFSKDDLDRLQSALGEQTRRVECVDSKSPVSFEPVPTGAVLVYRADSVPSRQLARVVAAQICAGGRVLLVRRPEERRPSLWLDTLRAELALPCFAPSSGPVLELIAPGLAAPGNIPELRFGKGSAVDVAALSSVRRAGVLLLCPKGSVTSRTELIRGRRAAAEGKKEEVLRQALRRVNGPARRGLVVHLRRRRCCLRSTEPLVVEAVTPAGIIVSRPRFGRLRALVEASALHELICFEPEERPVAPGERIRLTRETIAADGSRLRAGRHLVVKLVRADGSAILRGRKVLPPEAGHWVYDYCVSFDDPPSQAGVVICEAEELPRAVRAGWATCGRLVVCAAEISIARQAIAAAFPGYFDEGPLLPATEAINERLAAEPEPAEPPAPSATKPVAPHQELPGGDLSVPAGDVPF
jgi:hypothetical protein